jgi:hypothetical protein
MSLSLDREFKLSGPRGDGLLPYLNDEGAFLGDTVPLLERDELGIGSLVRSRFWRNC